MASSTSNASSGRSPALPVALAVGAVVGGVLLYNKSKTGSVDNIGKAMAKTDTPANTSGGLARMDADVSRTEYILGQTILTNVNPRRTAGFTWEAQRLRNTTHGHLRGSRHALCQQLENRPAQFRKLFTRPGPV